ncbi:hypothetical protein IFM89_004049 [Coptis chinensis]|uniref:DNA-3-methyladenine glycosylase I n=1 Tax=Coptis chinensis TaxID=261450 RepID=A0A835LHJ3_9MAGN|nr:hypothetical protein IFM89_004049 [Coptis chinensis]
MSKENVRKQVLEKNRSLKQKEKPGQNFISKHLKKVYPLGIQKSNSAQSLSSLSQKSIDSVPLNGNITPGDSNTPLSSAPMSPTSRGRKTPMSLIRDLRPPEIKEKLVSVSNVGQNSMDIQDGNLKRCYWITKNSDKAYVQYHDESWGVPVYDDIEAFAKFDPNVVAKMSEKEIEEISSNKDLAIVESQIVKEFGSFSSYLWGYMNYKPTISRYRYPKSVPLRSMKSESISKDLLRRGFRFAGPIIVYSFMQAAGMTMDHLIDCFRFNECVNLVEMRYECG